MRTFVPLPTKEIQKNACANQNKQTNKKKMKEKMRYKCARARGNKGGKGVKREKKKKKKLPNLIKK